MSLFNVVAFVISVTVHQGRGQKGRGHWEVISKCDKIEFSNFVFTAVGVVSWIINIDEISCSKERKYQVIC